MKKTTLSELGLNLPIGAKKYKAKSFAFKSWGMDEEKKIGELKRKHKTGQFLSEVLALMLDHCCGESFESLEHPRKLLMINQLPLMDVLYLWVYLRYDQVDEYIRMDVGCPFCSRMNKDFIANLGGLDVDCLEHVGEEITEEDEFTFYKVRKPFEIDEGEKVEQIKIARTPWDAMEKATDEIFANQGMLTEMIFKKSIIGINDEHGYVDIDKLNRGIRKRDIESLSNKITDFNGGPSLVVSGKCTFCANTFQRQLDWSYDLFFGSGSIPKD